MAWTDTLIQASFRGIPLRIRGIEKKYTLVVAKHQLVGHSGAFIEPIIEDSDVFTIDAFCVSTPSEPDYRIERDRLVDTLKKSPVGIYQDPLTGKAHYVVATSFTVSEGVEEGLGFAKVAITFEESLLDWNNPLTSDAARRGAVKEPSTYLGLANNAALTRYSTAIGAIQENIEGVTGTVQAINDEIDAYRAAIIGPLAGLILSAQELAASLDSISASATSLATAPQQLYEQLEDVVSTITSIEMLQSLAGQHAPTDEPAFTDPGQQAYALAQREVADMMHRLAVVYYGYAILSYPWESYNEAIAARDYWADLMLAEEQYLTDENFLDWQQARIGISVSLESIAIQLPKLITIEYQTPIATLEIAHRYYQDAFRADEISARNTSIIHPGFVQGTISILGE